MRHSRRLRAAAALASLLVTTGLTGGCAAWSELQFKQDHRLQFTSPENYELVDPPVEVAWTIEGFEVLPAGSGEPPSDDAGYFAVFVDQAPIRPGRTLEDVAGRDEACKRDPRCPDRRYLEAKAVYVTHQPRLNLELIPQLASKEKIQAHQLTVILLDSTGHRIGESAWYLQFKAEKLTSAVS
jgi:hypothetical protein